MKPFTKTVAALGVASTLALTLATPSEARSRWVGPAVGFAAGTIVGAAIASSPRYYDGYYGSYGYDSYAYAPGPGPVYYDTAPVYDSYAYPAPRRFYRLENARERQLRGSDY